MPTSAFTCSDQDVGVSQEGGQRRAFGALQDGKAGGVMSAENRVCVRTHPRQGACTALVPGGARARFVHAAWHRLTNARACVLTSGEILEGCSMQSCKAGKKTLMLAYFWRQHPFNPRFPLAFPSA